MTPLAGINFTAAGASVIGALCLLLSVAVWFLHRNRMASKDAELAVTKEYLNSYREMAELGVVNLEAAAREYLKAKGVPIPPALVPVVPEHASPVTDRQTVTAEIQTMRARLVAATLALDLPPRTAGDAIAIQ